MDLFKDKTGTLPSPFEQPVRTALTKTEAAIDQKAGLPGLVQDKRMSVANIERARRGHGY